MNDQYLTQISATCEHLNRLSKTPAIEIMPFASLSEFAGKMVDLAKRTDLVE